MGVLIDTLRRQHENIEHFTAELKASCIHFMETGELNRKAFREAVAFIRSYADEQHHRKEEDGLFAAMLEHLGEPARKLPSLFPCKKQVFPMAETGSGRLPFRIALQKRQES